MSQMVVEWMQMDESPRTGRAVRLLCVNGTGFVPHELLGEIARSGIEVTGVTEHLDEALRHALMGYPDIIVVPYVGDQVLDFLRAIEHMRGSNFSPYIVLVTDADHGAVLDKCDGFYRLSVLPRASVSEHLIPHLLRIAGQLRPAS